MSKKVFTDWNYISETGTLVEHRKYVYEGWNLIAELDALESDAVTRTYTWGLDLSGSFQGAGGIGGLLEMEDLAVGKTFIPIYDGNGNVGGLLDRATGDFEAEYEYSPYGELLRATGDYAMENPYRFSTKYADDETGLHFYGFRYYNASLGRLLFSLMLVDVSPR